MATCKDCVHYEVCVCHEQEMSAMLLKGGYRDISNDMTDGCRFFKNKADFVEVKHGEWIKGDMPTYGGYKCSVCRENTVHYKAKFCPECGADMRKEGADNG